VESGVGHPVVAAEPATYVEAAADDERTGNRDRLDNVRRALQRLALLSVRSNEVRGRLIDPCGAEGGERRAGGVDGVVRLEDRLRGRDGIRALGRGGGGGDGKRYREEDGDDRPVRACPQPDAAA
jgi:hypothetical protein